MANDVFVFNGIDATTGGSLLPPLSPAEVARVARGEKLDEEHYKQLVWRNEQRVYKSLGLKAGIDPTDLAQAGWGAIFAHDADPAIRQALAPLLKHARPRRVGASSCTAVRTAIGLANGAGTSSGG